MHFWSLQATSQKHPPDENHVLPKLHEVVHVPNPYLRQRALSDQHLRVGGPHFPKPRQVQIVGFLGAWQHLLLIPLHQAQSVQVAVIGGGETRAQS